MTRRVLLVTLVVCVAGCGGGLERIPISGEVTFNGQPIEQGQIRFMPKKGTEMPATVAKVTNGKYDTSASGGVPVGEYDIWFYAYDTRYPEASGPGAPGRPQLLPPKFNTRSEYEIAFESGQGAVKRDFQLTGTAVGAGNGRGR